jgi:release factor glutamine methyltransferase
MTRIEALKHLGEVFRQIGIETAQRDARLLMLDAAGIVHTDLIKAPREALGAQAAQKLSSHVEKRLTRVPVARILGEWEFWSLPFTLVAETLVPRPDSETVVAAALIALKDRRHANDGLRILDLGTGSGCLLVSLLHEMPGATGIGVDIAAEAVTATARRNAERNGVGSRAEFHRVQSGLRAITVAVRSHPCRTRPVLADPIIDTLEVEVPGS